MSDMTLDEWIEAQEPDEPTLREGDDPWPLDGYHAEDAYSEGLKDGYRKAAREIRALESLRTK